MSVEKKDEPSPIIQYGWVCPKCGSVYAPHTSECSRCSSSVFFHTNVVSSPVNTDDVPYFVGDSVKHQYLP